jgi:hypothetical protein
VRVDDVDGRFLGIQRLVRHGKGGLEEWELYGEGLRPGLLSLSRQARLCRL